MEHLIQWLTSISSGQEFTRNALVVIMSIAIFVAGIGIYKAIAALFDPVRRRIGATLKGGPSTTGAQVNQGFVRVANAAAPYIIPSNEKEREEVEGRLLHAGYRSTGKLTMYYGLKTVILLGLPALVFLAVPFVRDMSNKELLWLTAIAVMLGMLLPSMYLDRQVAKRQRALTNAFPDALDLLVVCTEAGLGLNAALQRVGYEMAGSHPILGEELGTVNAEIRAGVDRVEALRNLAKRTGLDEIRGLVGLLSQSLIFGTSVADALRVYSEEFRDKRMQRAEEEAAKLGTKMIFPLILCFFPAFFAIAVGPAAIRLIHVFGG